ncbi:tetratricopeptide repeat protein 37 isoform X1 [Glossina fuscipes]|uniref:Tetratricopeptide repeat protein 37 isoform X1 n=2 Tax=Glossina fuscipes TaxID=7396 RepID=A0A9C6DIX0_9MUSC|nr:tetratricopeptide repeat protein 37 isoform X1 [Glossina fuscipes]
MSAKEQKALLKEIRELIKNDKYREAISKCELVLKYEPNNYMGLLLLGAAYQNVDKQEAANYLRKAVQYSPTTPTVALQGLANCAPTDELPKILEQLIDLVPEKQSDYIEKLYSTSTKPKMALECFEIISEKLEKNHNEALRDVLLKYLGRIWIENDLSPALLNENLYKSALEAVISDPSLQIHFPAYKCYLKLLFKQNELTACLSHACKVIDLYPKDIYAYGWICKIYCDNYEKNQFIAFDGLTQSVDFYASKLLELNENSYLGLVVKAIDSYNTQQYVTSRQLLSHALKEEPNYMVAVKLLARTETHLEAYDLAEELWQRLGKEFREEYALCLSHAQEESKLQEALNLLNEENLSPKALQATARCYYKLGDLTKLKSLSMDDLTKAEFLLSPKQAIDYLNGSTIDLESFSSLLLLGKLYYKIGNFSQALNNILKATRLRPYSSECFFYLGKIYFALNDIVRSRKCFEKCITLNPLNDLAVDNLSAIYQQIDEEDLNVALLTNTLKYLNNSQRAKHLHYKLGLHYLSVNNFDEAIQSFRTAIKQDVSCMIYWESLGDAYAERGSYNSAIRVFQKILEMQPDNLYAQLQVALMKVTTRMYSESIENFDRLLKSNNDYLPALKGAAEAHLGLANYLKSEYRYGRAKHHLQTAVNMLQRCFLNSENLNMVWLWRLTANAFVLTAQMSESMANLDVNGLLAKRESEIVFLTRKDLFKLAARFYTCALTIKSNTYLWYELALCYYYMADYINEEAENHLDMATKACQMAIKEQSNRWQNWNLLGVINMHQIKENYPMAQHCFIQALNLDRKSYTTWTNLGVLYLRLHEIKLANQAFQRAQQSSPIYPNAWIGQAMIAETINEEEEALDLFRHCQQFEFHSESALGYAHWVCNMLCDPGKCELPHYKHAINNMHADVMALDAINWYVINEEKETSVSALSLQGFLSERQKLYRPAVKAYTAAASKATIGTERDLIFTNLGFAHLKLNEPTEAINAFNKVSQASFKPIIGLALAYFKAGQHQEAYSVYNSVLKSVVGAEDDKAARILVAMASMVYAFQGEADTKTILYQCILLKNSPVQALYSACALGILHQDTQLTETILNELRKYENSIEHIAHVAYLRAQYYLSIQKPRNALISLMTRVHIFPQCAALRKVLANFLLDNYGHKRQYHAATSQIALSAISLVHGSKTNKNDCIEDSQTLLIASRALQPVDKQNSLKLIQRAVHLYPNNPNAWNSLLQVH